MINKTYLVTKRIFQIILYLLEVIGVSYLLTFISNKFWESKNFIDFIQRMTIFYAFYQIVIYGILQQLNDVKKDEYLALLSMYKYIEIYNADKREYIKEDIIRLLNKQLDSSMLNDNDIRKDYLEIKEVLENNQSFDNMLLKLKIVKYEHCCEAVTLNWKYSILNRFFKIRRNFK